MCDLKIGRYRQFTKEDSRTLTLAKMTLAKDYFSKTKSQVNILRPIGPLVFSSPVQKYRKSYCNHTGVPQLLIKFLAKVFMSISLEHDIGLS